MAEDLFTGLLDDFLLEARERTDRAEELLLAFEAAAPDDQPGILDETKREFHTLKGLAGMMGLKNLQSLAHALEDLLAGAGKDGGSVQEALAGLDRFRAHIDAVGQGQAPDQTTAAGEGSGIKTEREASVQGSVRVPFQSLDDLVDLLAEMVIFKNRLADAIARMSLSLDRSEEMDDVEASHEALGKTLVFLQDRIMRLRMVPLRTLFGNLARIVHDEKRREGKEVEMEATGGETPLDKALLEVASEALGHLVRNAVIHGLETPAERRAVGKPAEGRLLIAAKHRSSEVEIVVEDDGAGIDRAALFQKARERGIAVGEGDDLQELLFHAGLSSREGTDIGAGRGMGLYAALQAVQRLGGRIDVASEAGRFSRFSLHLPLSVSIMPSLLVKTDGEEYALPLSSVVEILKFREGDGHLVNHAGVFTWRDQVIPLLDLGNVFETSQGLRERGYVILVGAEGRTRGVIADDISGMREIVVKGLDRILGTHRGVAGSTILGDGRVVLILDPQALVGLKPFVRDPEGGPPCVTGEASETGTPPV